MSLRIKRAWEHWDLGLVSLSPVYWHGFDKMAPTSSCHLSQTLRRNSKDTHQVLVQLHSQRSCVSGGDFQLIPEGIAIAVVD